MFFLQYCRALESLLFFVWYHCVPIFLDGYASLEFFLGVSVSENRGFGLNIWVRKNAGLQIGLNNAGQSAIDWL